MFQIVSADPAFERIWGSSDHHRRFEPADPPRTTTGASSPRIRPGPPPSLAAAPTGALWGDLAIVLGFAVRAVAPGR